MQITEQIIQRIARQVFNQMFPSSLRQSGAVISGAGSSVQYAVEAGHAASADSASSVPWTGVSSRPTKLSDFTNDVVSASVSGSTLTVNIGGTAYSLTDTNTWRPVVDNLTSTDTDKSLSAKQGYNLANGSARDNTKLPLAGGTMTGTLNLRTNGYKANNEAGINCNNSDIIGLNALYTNDLSDDWSESIQFARTNGNYDSFRAADGTFYFGINSGTERVWITPSAGSADMGLVLNGTSYRMEFMIGSGNVNRGIFDRTSGINKWLLYFDANNTILNYGNVGIGTSSPSYKLHVVGAIYCTSGFTVLSDIRKKDVITYQWAPALSAIAEAPIIRYTLKDDKEKRERIGSVAQYWQKITPEAVTEAHDGTLSMDYGSIALTSVIALAREVKQLKAQVARLTQQRNG